MTDSMKFGPEWLRNMSGESSNLVTTTGGNSSTNYTSTNSVNTSGPSSGSTAVIGSSGNQNNTSHVPAPKNLFPEFRYGREEMLSLFDKNCGIPEILPSYKKIFVDKVQYPLALTPTTDEEMISQGTTISTQRPPWMQRSPVGFNCAVRGIARGGSVDRGRMRGKSIFHNIYQRPTPMFEDDPRPSNSKSDRNWSERNGVGDGLGTEWNNTPTSSPRKEFSSHTRNMENWRRNRSEDGSGDSSGTMGSSDGWRGSNIATFTHRWGRSASWRDDELSSGNIENSLGVGMMQRSLSTISTTTGGSATSRGLNALTGINNGMQNTRNNQSSWSSCIGSSGSNVTGMDSEDNIPEWAIENPSDGGGTFDASGAFHGSPNDDSSHEIKIEKCEINSESSKFQGSSPKSGESFDVAPKEDNINNQESKTPMETSNVCEPNISQTSKNQSEKKENKEVVKEEQDVKADSPTQTSSLNSKEVFFENNSKNPTATVSLQFPQSVDLKTNSDYPDRMQEVADDMVEKLIMDDDNVTDGKISNNVSALEAESSVNVGVTASNELVSPTIAAIMKPTGQAQNTTINPNGAPSSTVSTLNTAATHKTMPLYGVVIDHATLAQQHLQQQQLTAATGLPSHASVAMTSTPSDLWYYRDPQSKVQGPFTAIEMTEWYRAGYFDENLFVRRVCDACFRPLGDLTKLCHGNMPFTHSHLLPIGFDNVHPISNSSIKPPTEQREEYKGNVIATADSLSAAVKNLSPADIGHMLQMHFQILQDQYLQRQEYMIVRELMKQDWFQRLTHPERDALVRQKLQVLGLPEYLSSLTGLSNSLATLTPATNQLYDTINNYSKRDIPYASNVNNTQQHPLQQSGTANINTFIDPDNYAINPQQQFDNVQFGSVLGANNSSELNQSNGKIVRNDEVPSGNELFNNFNLRMFAPQQVQKSMTTDFISGNATNPAEFLTEQQILTNSTVGTISNPSPIMQMWIPNQQSQILGQQVHQPTQSQSNQWAGGPLVGISGGVIETGHNVPQEHVTKLLHPTAMWGVSSLSQTAEHIQENDMKNIHDHSGTKNSSPVSTVQQIVTLNEEDNSENIKKERNSQLKLTPPLETVNSNVGKPTQKKDDAEKHHQNSNKRNMKVANPTTTKSKDENTSNVASQKNQDDRRREPAEDKRRHKEERKQQQLEEAERRTKRQMLEEKDRVQQIQAQRRKALLGSSNGNNSNVSSSTGASTTSTNNNAKQNKEQRVMKTSVAPWSTQTNASAIKNGPCLAEIQKAERRERRADQQRQMEMMVRANAIAASEVNESTLTWNAAPLPVKSFVEIQAEEAKRLACEQLETQRRKESEQNLINVSNISVSSTSLTTNTIGSGTNSSSLNNTNSSISTIWGNGAKVWGGTSTAGFWEEPTKVTTNVVGSGPSSSSAVGTASHSTKSSNQVNQQQQKQTVTVSNPQDNIARNLRKSQTVSVMQNTSNTLAKNVKNQNQTKQGGNNKPQQKSDENRKNSKSNSGNGGSTSTSGNTNVNTSYPKRDSFENEFNSWCIKSLNNMNTKVDVPTFVTFLQDLESPYEVKDYIRMYLGETKEYTEFAKQFLEKRSKYKNLQRAQNAHNDDMCKPAPAINPSSDNSDNKGKQKKFKKNKMTKLDARILGFSVTAAEGRINVGDRDYVDAP